MGLEQFTIARAFQERIIPTLGQNEIFHNLILGIASRLVDMPEVHTEAAYMAVVEGEGVLRLAALMTPLRDLIFAAARAPIEADVRLIVQNLIDGGWQVPGVHAADASATLFAQVWEKLTGMTYKVEMSLRLFDLREVIPPRPTAGHLRLAEAGDLDVVVAWMNVFEEETVGRGRLEVVRKLMRRRIDEGDVYLWVDGEPVSMSVVVRKSARGAVVGGVYTPTELRGKGYASACVAGLSQAQLDAGKEYCALFTDLANPTSNHIYQAIGYRPICDFKHFRFSDS
jgi:uncharacterized protein